MRRSLSSGTCAHRRHRRGSRPRQDGREACSPVGWLGAHTCGRPTATGGDPKQGLMRFAGTLPDLDSKATTWDVPTSMRNVDAECRLAISLAYAQADVEGEGV